MGCAPTPAEARKKTLKASARRQRTLASIEQVPEITVRTITRPVSFNRRFEPKREAGRRLWGKPNTSCRENPINEMNQLISPCLMENLTSSTVSRTLSFFMMRAR